MKKLSKLMALLLSLLMIMSLFAACGDDKKDDDKKDEETKVSADKDNDKDEDEDEDKKNDKEDEKDEAISAEDMLIGDWERETVVEALTYVTIFTFDEDGTVEVTLSEDCYDEIIESGVEESMAELTDEDIASDGFESREDAEEFIREYLMEELPYDYLAAEFEMSGTWELDGDTLTVEFDGEPKTTETDLSDGGTTITFDGEDGETITLEKAN